MLQSTNRGGQTCSDFFEKMCHLSDELSATGVVIPDNDLVSYILSGLGAEFNSFVVTLTTRSDPISLSDLHGFLLAHEKLFFSQHQIPLAPPGHAPGS